MVDMLDKSWSAQVRSRSKSPLIKQQILGNRYLHNNLFLHPNVVLGEF